MTIYILQKRIAEYRIETFNAICQLRPDIVICSEEPPKHPVKFRWVNLKVDRRKCGLSSWNIPFDPEVDILITGLDLRNLSLLSIIFGAARYVVIWTHGFGRRWGSFFVRPLRLAAAARATASVFYTDSAKDQFARWISDEKLFVARNTIALAGFEADLSAQRDSYLYFGDYRDEKGLTELVDAFAVLSATHPKMRLVFVGNGPAEAVIRTRAARSGFSDRIEFHPRTSTPEGLKRFLDRAIGTISPWHVGLSVVQSFWAGVPIVTRPGPRHAPEFEYCLDGDNALFYQGGVSGLAEAMGRLLDPDLREKLSQNARKYYLERLGVEAMVQGFDSAIRFCELRSKR